jgi:membrane protein implicated in regulation of membrane protease activity
MGSVTVAFLVIGGIGVLILAASLLIGDFCHFGDFGDLHGDGPFSIAAIAGFIGAFGFAGAIASSLAPAGTPAGVAAVVAGIVAAVPTAWFAGRLIRAASNMRTDATPRQSDLIGTFGVIVTPVPKEGYGEVRVSLGGQPVKLNARASEPIRLGAQVFVVEALSPTSVVVEETLKIEES